MILFRHVCSPVDLYGFGPFVRKPNHVGQDMMGAVCAEDSEPTGSETEMPLRDWSRMYHLSTLVPSLRAFAMRLWQSILPGPNTWAFYD